MDNREKAKQICKGYNYRGRLTPTGVAGFVVDRCVEMADFKDQQLKERASPMIASCNELYNDISDCIFRLIKARLGHNIEEEGRALCRMEGLMTATQQQLSCINDFFKEDQL